jgi:hypothetical protein
VETHLRDINILLFFPTCTWAWGGSSCYSGVFYSYVSGSSL